MCQRGSPRAEEAAKFGGLRHLQRQEQLGRGEGKVQVNTRPTAQNSIAVCFPVAAEGAGDVCWRGATDGAAEQRRRIGVRSSRRCLRQRTRRGCTALWHLSKCKSERWKDPGLRENQTKLRVWDVPATLNTNKQINSVLFSTSSPALRTARLDVQRIVYPHHDESLQNIEGHRRASQICYCIKIPCVIHPKSLYEVIK